MLVKRGLHNLKAMANYIVKHNGWDKNVAALDIVDGGKGTCVAEFDVTKQYLNSNGKLHTGFIATIVDNITTYALMSHPCHPGVSVDLQLNIVDEAKLGDRLVATAKTVRAGKKLAYIECELRQKKEGNNGKIVAKGAQTKYVDFGSK